MRLAQGETGTGRRAIQRSNGWVRWRVPLVAAGLLIVPVVIEVTRSNPNARYPQQSDRSAAPVDEADLNPIREAVVRYQMAHLVPTTSPRLRRQS